MYDNRVFKISIAQYGISSGIKFGEFIFLDLLLLLFLLLARCLRVSLFGELGDRLVALASDKLVIGAEFDLG